MSLAAENLSWSAGRRTILDGVSLTVRPGRLLGLLGPNGSGKTSLLRLLAGLQKPQAGRVTLDGADLAAIDRRAVARRVAFVQQHAATDADLRVIDVVKLGRFPHRTPLAAWSDADEEAVAGALSRTGLADRRRDRWRTLSGGERQRVQIARALAQAPRELLLDEPTNHLDIEHQIGLMRLVAGLATTCVVALHDLNHAALFCDEIVVLQRGRVVASGTPEAVMTEDALRRIFAVEARVMRHEGHPRPNIVYVP